ncbi:hypothetical protein [Xanthovirga aplysinae]|uniref:hypothetical protein n=1 Tax=Xanthovirga aplysinae TaxID=2529853 RepID=UPI0012BCF900|nr:hypothetical protein [Xanthovirga aplysinae]MTI31667.1 hypothetical protein [Xanthovirga aplysinae]
MSKKIILRLALFLFLGVASIVYIQLGGFNEVKISVKENINYTLIGKSFEGRYKSKEVKNIFFDTRRLLEEGELHGTLAIIYDQDPSENEGNMKSFTGIILEKPISKIPKGFEERKFKAFTVVQAQINAHPLVMPTPEKIKEKLKIYAQEQGLELQDISIEKLVGERELVVEIPVKQ